MYVAHTAARLRIEGYHFQCIRGRVVCPLINFLRGCAPKATVCQETLKEICCMEGFKKLPKNPHQCTSLTERAVSWAQVRWELWQRNPMASERTNSYFLSSHSEWVNEWVSGWGRHWSLHRSLNTCDSGYPGASLPNSPWELLSKRDSHSISVFIHPGRTMPDIMSNIKCNHLHFLLLTQSLPRNKLLASNKTFLYNWWTQAQYSH